MDRVYLLLRNNQQTGPFTIGELLQQQLRPSDMIWIEGKSTAWTYLSELELIPFVKPSIAEENKQAKSADEIERKAEELRQKILSSTPRTYFPQYRTEIETYTSPYKLPEDEIQFIDHRKERSTRRNTALTELLLTCFVVGLFAIGIYKGKSILGARKQVHPSVATQLTSGDEHAAQKNNTPQLSVTASFDTVKQHDSLIAIQTAKPRLKKLISDSSANPSANSVAPIVIQTEKKEETTQTTPPIDNTVKKEETPIKKDIVPSVPELNNNNAPVQEEKRGFLKGLFKKKKKEESSSAKADDKQDH
jgi:hypothetical protein